MCVRRKTGVIPWAIEHSYCVLLLILLVAMYICYLCGDDVKLHTVDKLRFHLLRHKDNCELLGPIRCRQGRTMQEYIHKSVQFY